MEVLSINFFVTVAGFLTVFVVFCVLIALLQLVGWMTKARQKEAVVPEEVVSVVSAAESAAIAMALHLCRAGVHDEESDVITLRNVDLRYSPWSSKIYGIQ